MNLVTGWPRPENVKAAELISAGWLNDMFSRTQASGFYGEPDDTLVIGDRRARRDGARAARAADDHRLAVHVRREDPLRHRLRHLRDGIAANLYRNAGTKHRVIS